MLIFQLHLPHVILNSVQALVPWAIHKFHFRRLRFISTCMVWSTIGCQNTCAKISSVIPIQNSVIKLLEGAFWGPICSLHYLLSCNTCSSCFRIGSSLYRVGLENTDIYSSILIVASSHLAIEEEITWLYCPIQDRLQTNPWYKPLGSQLGII